MIVGLFGILFFLFVLVLAALAFVFWIWMLVDCIRNDRLSSNERVLWALVIFFLHAIGALIYLLVGRTRAVA
jgi:hypothetical protein